MSAQIIVKVDCTRKMEKKTEVRDGPVHGRFDRVHPVQFGGSCWPGHRVVLISLHLECFLAINRPRDMFC